MPIHGKIECSGVGQVGDTAHALETHVPVREFRLAPQLRRCAAYWAAGWFLLTGLIVALYLAGDVPGVRGPLYLSPMFFGPAVLAWRYRIRVDGRGVWRRRLFGWDLWAWDAFAAGTVREGVTPYSWLNSNKPWYWRKLSFAILADADRDWLMERVRQVWTPPAVPLPEEIKIRIPGFPWRHIDLSPRGIVLWQEKDEQTRHYRWSDVVRVGVTRFAHWRRDFTRLELELPAGEPGAMLRGRPDGNRCNWDGSDAEVVLAYLRQYAADRFQVTAETGAPQTRDEADRRLRDLERKFRELRQVEWFLYAGLLVCGVLLLCMGRGAAGWDGYQWFAAGLFYFLEGLNGLALWMLVSRQRRRYEERRAEIASQIPEVAADAAGSGG